VNTEGLDLAILGPAFVAGLLVLSTHVPLGRAVLERGIIFIDLAIAQVAGLGVIAAHGFDWDPRGWQVQLIAFAAAMCGALLLSFTEKRWPEIQEALIGSLFVLAATGGLLLLAKNPHGGEHLRDLLAGQILWVGFSDLWPIAFLSAALLAVWFWRTGPKPPWLFYGVFALAVTSSVQLVGVYLVFASLIIPALAVRKANGRGLLWAYLFGAFAYAGGLVASALYDLPAGATIVWALAVLAFAVAGAIGTRRSK
jgi:zinc/manganese transport system permease protein